MSTGGKIGLVLFLLLFFGGIGAAIYFLLFFKSIRFMKADDGKKNFNNAATYCKDKGGKLASREQMKNYKGSDCEWAWGDEYYQYRACNDQLAEDKLITVKSRNAKTYTSFMYCDAPMFSL